MRTFEKIYRDRGIVFSADVAPQIRFRGEQQDLEEMIGNLVDNAGKWARHQVTITAVPIPTANIGGKQFFRVTIDDDGVGLAPELREAAIRRGRRLDETRPGSASVFRSSLISRRSMAARSASTPARQVACAPSWNCPPQPDCS